MKRRTMIIKQVAGHPRVDGDLSRLPWQNASWNGGFHVLEAPEQLASPETRFCLFHNNEHLYIGLQVDEPEVDRVKPQEQSHTLAQTDDRIEIFVDPTVGKNGNVYIIAVNSSGTAVVKPLTAAGEGPHSNQLVRSKHTVRKDNKSWAAQIAIPMADLELDPNSDMWRVNVVRVRYLTEAGGSLQKMVSTFMPLDSPGGGFFKPLDSPFAQVDSLDLGNYLWTVNVSRLYERADAKGNRSRGCQVMIRNLATSGRDVRIRMNTGADESEVVLSRHFEAFEQTFEFFEFPEAATGNEIVVIIQDQSESTEMLYRRLRLVSADSATVSWKRHLIMQHDGSGGFDTHEGEAQFLSAYMGNKVIPFGLTQMDNGEVAVFGACRFSSGEITVIAFSSDGGASWSEYEPVPGSLGRPVMLAWQGNGRLSFVGNHYRHRFFSSDYGRTWEQVPIEPASNAKLIEFEGNPMVDFDEKGQCRRITECGFTWGDQMNPDGGHQLEEFIRSSTNGGRTWEGEQSPEPWYYTQTINGQVYRCTGHEGSLIRARNGWIIVALRTPVTSERSKISTSDHLCGMGISISEDDGLTWTPLTEHVLFDGGRMHPHLLMMPNGDIVMTLIKRIELDQDGFAGYGRGCEALISRDNGLTWDKQHMFVLDETDDYDGANWWVTSCGHLCSTLLDSGHILTAFGSVNGGKLVKWQPTSTA